MKPIHVVIIDSSSLMSNLISTILKRDNRIQVDATAKNGIEGLEKIKSFLPDVVILDVEMPMVDETTTLQKIMESSPLPVVMISNSTAAQIAKTVRAISMGAVDFIRKPPNDLALNSNAFKQEVINKVLTASEAKIKLLRSAKVNLTKSTQLDADISDTFHKKTVVTIGTSTGGPRALQRVLTDLPSDFGAPILIVQHMPAGFTKSLAERLNGLAHIHVKEASDGETIEVGTAYIAPGNYHMKTIKVGASLVIELTQEPERSGHRPSVDVLFESIADLKNINKIAVVLTGMGKDGAEGIIRIKDKDEKAIAIAESKESTIVYGMPLAVIRTNRVNEIVHLHKMGETINSLVKISGGI